MHTVQADESLISIAIQYGLTIEALQAVNKLKDFTHLESGQTVLIPTDDRAVQVKVVLHQYEVGDTLLSIASKYGSSVATIQAVNPQLGSGSLRPGQLIAVPLVLPDPNPATAAKRIATPVVHTVQAGEFPLEIAARYDVPVEILLAANRIADPRRLRAGQRLTIPTQHGLSLAEMLVIRSEPVLAPLTAGKTVAIPVILGQNPARSAVASIPFNPIPAPALQLNLQKQMIAAVNAERAAAGLPAYRPDEALAAVALEHAQDMVERDFADHINPDGQSPRDRLEASGITGLKRVGENIQLNTWPAELTVRAAVDWFMDSRPHRLNILNPHYTHVGVAAVRGPPGWHTFVIEFAEK
jgi:uncharacterized protein YkwD